MSKVHIRTKDHYVEVEDDTDSVDQPARSLEDIASIALGLWEDTGPDAEEDPTEVDGTVHLVVEPALCRPPSSSGSFFGFGVPE